MNVFVISCVYQRDSGDCGNYIVGVFKDFKTAQRILEKEIEYAKHDIEDITDLEETDYAKGDMTYSIWERENYCYNHIDLKITEMEVK